MALIILYVLGSVLAIFFAIIFVRWLFRVDDKLEFQRLQYSLLVKMANKMGIQPDAKRELNKDEIRLDDDGI